MAGGSLAGLMHAIVLRSLGNNVHVLNKSAPEVLQSQASGVGCMSDVRKFIEEYTNEREPYAITLETIEFMNEKGKSSLGFPLPIPTTLLRGASCTGSLSPPLWMRKTGQERHIKPASRCRLLKFSAKR